MEPSLFEEFVLRYFPKLVVSTTNTLNGEERIPPYYHLRFLRPRYSVTGKWEALSNMGVSVAADVIALDSSIPLKRRASVGEASGTIPKIATERQLNETQLSQLRILLAQNNELEFRRMLFEDTPEVIISQYEKMELMFLQALSTGAILVDENTNVGTGIRVDFRYLAKNQFTASVPWGSTGYTPIDDIIPVLRAATTAGRPIRLILIDPATYQLVLNSNQAKAMFANSLGISSTNGFTPTKEQFNTAFQANYGARFEEIDRAVNVEINGVRKSIVPWESGQLIMLNNERVGDVVWSEVAEMAFPVAGVTYQRAGRQNYINVKKYRSVRPSLAEFTASEALALPVIAGVEQIYKLDSTQGASS